MKIQITKFNRDWDIVEINDFESFTKTLKIFAAHLIRDIKVVSNNERVTANANDYLPKLNVKKDKVFDITIPALSYLLAEGKIDDYKKINFANYANIEYLIDMCSNYTHIN